MWYQRSRLNWFQVEFTELLQAVQPKVIVEMNIMLTNEFKEFEVSKALKQMYPLKSPSPDGIPPLFFQHFCPTTAGVVTKTVLDFLDLAFEILNHINQKKIGKIGEMALKLDMSKAYDKVEWHVLKVYEEASSQQLNRAKTSLFFSSNTDRSIQNEIKTRFGAQIIKQHEKYLGLPSLVGRNRRNTFNEVKENLAKKLYGWKEKFLSKAGKEISLVSDLIEVDRKSWKMDLLKQVFMPFEVENIGGIPLSIRLPEDKQIWAEASNGYFSVRSAYKIALELDKHDDKGSISDESHMRSFWKKLWKERWQEEDSTLAITMVWALWTNRNNIHHGGLRKNGKQIFHWSTKYLDEYWAATAIPIKYNLPLESRWVPPVDLVYKALRDVSPAPSSVAYLVYGMIAATYGSQCVNFSHVQRQDNRLAHLLAKNALCIDAEAKAFEEGIVFAEFFESTKVSKPDEPVPVVNSVGP
uniref:Reverse transcriptase domain-containing protein n=1 Tax=Quercus lobata TaxID=97700 RepID=A0A7N2MJJ8_QUELO